MARPHSPAAGVEILRRVSYLASVPATELRRVAARSRMRSVGPGDTVFDEGEACPGLLVIDEGLVEIRQISLRGREQVFHTEGPGATLGEVPLFDAGGYLASAVASAPTRLLLLPRAEVMRLCQRHPAVALAMLKTVARRARQFASIITNLAFRPVTERLAHYLEATAGEPVAPGTRVELTLTQAQLAARLGTVRELVARAFAELQDRGIITRARSRLVIRDPVGLAALARGAGDRRRGVTWRSKDSVRTRPRRVT